MPSDSPTPLASVASFSEGPFANLVSGFSTQATTNLMLQATRACESACDRRLTPFTNVVETQRADSLDVEDALDSYVPLDPTSQLGFSRAQSLGSTLMVRHCWLREHPPRYPEMWAGSITSINLLRSFSGQQAVAASTLQYEPDTGHVRFQLGTFVPPGTTIQVTYSGGYSTVPADLVQACQYMAASMAVKQLDPVDGRSGHDPDALRADALEMLAPYTRR
ncbi:hypothetical protein [Streptomyces noursei]|uniref:hypothetical protein n=1 Tax=Streptomyces noursei TaxID=1971 RepID=UPI00167ADEC5|nr:hypothetical protein [Streptomyces noursei]MCZ1013947.1 hypothetical protein [Streptomyces noursei]GGX40662.1 hypothetical protein GCM10010341_73260 [Streptomyces noursei]